MHYPDVTWISSSVWLLLVGAFLLSALSALCLTPLVARLARRFDIVDRPGGRRVHEGEIPRLGGVAIFLGLLLGSLTLGLRIGWHQLFDTLVNFQLLVLLGSCLLVFAVGVLDDIRSLSPISRLLTEAIAAAMLIQAGFVIDVVATPWGTPIDLGVLSTPITMLWFVGVTNAFNLVDGLDGLLATVGATVLVGCAAVGLMGGLLGTPLMALALAGSLVGFLYWNRHPARVFMGDSGSLLVGFTIAVLVVKVSRNAMNAFSLHIALAFCALPITEACLTLARRYVNGQPYFVGDRSHIHHVLIKKGMAVRRAVATLTVVSALFVAIGVLSRFWRDLTVVLVICALSLAAFSGLRWLGYVELRVIADRIQGLFRRRRGELPAVLAIAQAGDCFHGVDTADSFRQALRDAVLRGGYTYLALELTPLGESLLDEVEPLQELLNPAAEQYCSSRTGRPTCLVSTPREGADGPEIQLALPLPVETGRYGLLVCQRRYDPHAPSPSIREVQRYVLAPIGGALDRLEARVNAEGGVE